MTMSGFAAKIATLFPTYLQGVPIVDKTGLTGGWTFRLTITPNSNFVTAPGGISLEAALRQQLGLGLILGPVPTNVLVVDAASETPTPNDSGIAKVIASKFPNDFEVAPVKSAAPDAAASLEERLARTKMQVSPSGGIDFRNVAFSTLLQIELLPTNVEDKIGKLGAAQEGRGPRRRADRRGDDLARTAPCAEAHAGPGGEEVGYHPRWCFAPGKAQRSVAFHAAKDRSGHGRKPLACC